MTSAEPHLGGAGPLIEQIELAPLFNPFRDFVVEAMGRAVELFGQVMLEDDLMVEPIDYDDGTASVPAGPGRGVDLDMDALDRYAAGPTIVLERGRTGP